MNNSKILEQIQILCDRIDQAGIGTLSAYETISSIRSILNQELLGSDVDLEVISDIDEGDCKLWR